MEGIYKVAKEEIVRLFKMIVADLHAEETGDEDRTVALSEFVVFCKFGISFYLLNDQAVREDIWSAVRADNDVLRAVMRMTVGLRMKMLDLSEDSETDQRKSHLHHTLINRVKTSLLFSERNFLSESEMSTSRPVTAIDNALLERFPTEEELNRILKTNDWLIVLFIISETPLVHLLPNSGS